MTADLREATKTVMLIVNAKYSAHLVFDDDTQSISREKSSRTRKRVSLRGSDLANLNRKMFRFNKS